MTARSARWRITSPACAESSARLNQAAQSGTNQGGCLARGPALFFARKMTAAASDPIPPSAAPSTSRARGLLELVSSMRFAIALLTVICIASVIGTVLKQQEPLGNYINQ